MGLQLLAVLLVLAMLWHEREHLGHFIRWAKDSNHRPRIVAERSVGDYEHIEPDSVVLPPPPPVDMPTVVRRRYEHHISQQMAALRSRIVQPNNLLTTA